MFANRYTALVDACSLASVMRRNLLLSLAEAEFFRLRWSERILDETQAAIDTMAERKGLADHAGRAARARRAMQTAFEDAMVTDYARYLALADGLPDPDNAHVVAAALKTQAPTIITENLRDSPRSARPARDRGAQRRRHHCRYDRARSGSRDPCDQANAAALQEPRDDRGDAAD